jgi:uncharacterized integral membrane protein
MHVFLFLALIITTALVIFALQNLTNVTISFLPWRFEGPLAFILSLIFAAGLFTGLFLSLPAWWRRTKEVKLHKKRVHELEGELTSMKPEMTEEVKED